MQDYCFEGDFWLVAESEAKLKNGKFRIVGQRVRCNSEGTIQDRNNSGIVQLMTHQQLYNSNARIRELVGEFNHYHRARVRVLNGYAFITLYSHIRAERLVHRIVTEFNLFNLLTSFETDVDFRGDAYMDE